jgi:hypothetical protein
MVAVRRECLAIGFSPKDIHDTLRNTVKHTFALLLVITVLTDQELKI